MKKILTIDKLTVYVTSMPSNRIQYNVEIDKKYANLNNLDELDDLESESMSFFQMDSNFEKDNKIILSYIISNDYKSFAIATQYNRSLKLELAYNLIKSAPLLESNGKTFLDPNNIFFQDTQKIKILYRSNGLIPFDESSAIEQYKHFIFGFLSYKYSYKKYLANKEETLKKENDTFFYEVNRVLGISDLLNLVENELIKEKTKFYNSLEQKKIKQKSKKIRYISIGFGGLMLLSTLMFVGIQKNKNKLDAQYNNQMETLKNENNLLQCISTGDTPKAIELLKKQGASNENIAKTLFNMGEYNKAIDYNPQIETEVINILYKLNQKDKVLSLDSRSSFIEKEKLILTGDINRLDEQIALIKNKETLERLGMRFIENNLLIQAKKIESMISSGKFSKYIKKKELEIQLEKNLNEISSAKIQKTPEMNKQIIDIQKEIINLEEELKSYE